jgi:hypothetical protein
MMEAEKRRWGFGVAAAQLAVLAGLVAVSIAAANCLRPGRSFHFGRNGRNTVSILPTNEWEFSSVRVYAVTYAPGGSMSRPIGWRPIGWFRRLGPVELFVYDR